MRVAVLGATGLVGGEMLRCLETSGVKVDDLVLLASPRSAGRRVEVGGVEHEVRAVGGDDVFAGVDVVLASAGAEASRRWLPAAVAAGAVCIDNSSAFRMDDDVPLVVPEVNPGRAVEHPRGIVANPNCSTIQLVVVLKPLLDAAGLRRVRVSTYQGVSGAGRAACRDLEEGSRRHLAGDPAPAAEAGHVFNVVPWIDTAMAGGESREEWKMRVESAKILETDLSLHATCVRVPVFVGHSEAVWVETEEPLDAEAARRLLAAAPGVVVVDDPAAGVYPTPRAVAGDDRVFVGRVRRDPTVEHGLAFWVVADNLRKGAAANAVAVLALLAADAGRAA